MRGAAEFVAELEIVAADLPGVVVDEVPVGVDALARHAGGGADHGERSPTEIFGRP